MQLLENLQVSDDNNAKSIRFALSSGLWVASEDSFKNLVDFKRSDTVDEALRARGDEGQPTGWYVAGALVCGRPGRA